MHGDYVESILATGGYEMMGRSHVVLNPNDEFPISR